MRVTPRKGAKVCVADLDLAAAAETARRVEAAGSKALAVRTDTTDEAANDAMVAALRRRRSARWTCWSPPRAWRARARRRSPRSRYTLLDIPTERFRAVIDVNLYGVLFSNRAVARWMVANRRGGSLVNLGSIMSRMPSPGGAYSVSKAGVWMAHQVPGPGAGPPRHPGQRHRARGASETSAPRPPPARPR